MPLRDHFHPPLRDRLNWEGFHSAWVNTLVRQLNTSRLPARYRAEPEVRWGAYVEVDVATFEEDPAPLAEAEAGNGAATAVAVAVWAPPRPAQTFAVDLPAQDVFELRVYDERRSKRLVAAVELVSPANKDRPAHRRAFAVKCAAYLQQQVSVVIVDVVTERRDSLHDELMQVLDRTDPPHWPEPPPLYAVAYRTTKVNEAWRLDAWAEVLRLGATPPTLPLWLASDLAVPLELEASYEETCRVLRI
jgi:hypothetical protein